MIKWQKTHIYLKLLRVWQENWAEYSKDDIHHLEPTSEEAVFLKYLIENGFANLSIKLNGKDVGNFGGENGSDINIELGVLTIQKNGETIGTYNGNTGKTVNISVPTITYGTGEPSGGNNGDVYLRYL